MNSTAQKRESHAVFGSAPLALNPRSLVKAMLLMHMVLAGSLAWLDAPTIDEPGQLVAGLSHWRLQRFALFRVNPPLTRCFASLPLHLAGIEVSWDGYSEAPAARSEFQIADVTFRRHSGRMQLIVALARWACLPVSLVGAYLTHRWALELFGEWAAALALFLWCFDPTILTWAHLITSDIGAATASIAAAYAYWRWSQTGGWRGGIIAALALGVALLCKFTCLVLALVLPALWLVRRVASRSGSGRRDALKIAASLAILLLIVNSGYLFQGSFTRLGEYEFISTTFGGPRVGRTLADPRNRFAGTWLAAVPVPLPKDYLLGIDHIKWEFETKMWSYLNGERRFGGWWHYYFSAIAVKTPLGAWALALAALWAFVARPNARRCVFDEMFLLAPLLAIMALVSSQTGFSHHLRYALPAYPFALVWISRLAADGALTTRLAPGLMVSCALATAGSVLWRMPYVMSYFNELAGGPAAGDKYVIDSNLDWGQDMYRLRHWQESHPAARPLQAALFTGLDPAIFGIDVVPILAEAPPGENVLSPARAKTVTMPPGWYAVSVHKLRMDEEFAAFRAMEPVDRCGYSIRIYHVTE